MTNVKICDIVIVMIAVLKYVYVKWRIYYD
ncbi:hypothetical protein ACQ27_gp626 [Klebsiella phage K64-1]|nr:hypothetical protein ACQ27_gp626 [Klebsiella phage K64-1]